MNSDWIFESELLEAKIGMAIFGFLTFLGLMIGVSRSQFGKEEYPVTTKGYIIFCSITAIFTCLCYIDFHNWESFSSNRAETKGTIIGRKIIKNQLYYTFKYSVDHKEFISERHNLYYGKEIKGINYPDGKYVVVYNRNKPEQSSIDFRRDIK